MVTPPAAVATAREYSAPAPRQSRGDHLPELDGLRAIAIGLVLLYHFAGWRQVGGQLPILDLIAPAGWIGVDLFFVLSGFLITGICLDHAGSGFFRAFYGRRAIRILPAYTLLLTVLTAVSLVAMRRPPMGLAWTATFLTNVAMTIRGSHAVSPAMQHLWSLAVEEQFYLVWPACVVLLPRRASVWLAMFAVPLALCVRVALVQPENALVLPQVLMPERMDSLALGALMAYSVRSRRWSGVSAHVRHWRGAWTWAALTAALCVGLTLLSMRAPSGTLEVLMFCGRYSIVAVFFVALLAATFETRGRGSLSWLLVRPAMLWLGRRSYGLYLIHVPVAATMQAAGLTPSTPAGIVAFALGGIGASCALAELSWRTVERPFLSLKTRFPYGAAIRGFRPTYARSQKDLEVSPDIDRS